LCCVAIQIKKVQYHEDEQVHLKIVLSLSRRCAGSRRAAPGYGVLTGAWAGRARPLLRVPHACSPYRARAVLRRPREVDRNKA
jgi:hypothetical protein